MKSIVLNKVFHVHKALAALEADGIRVITIRANGQIPGSPLADSAEIVLDDSANVAAAQAILDAFDPVQAQAEVEAEETAERTRAEKLRTLDEWLRTQTKDVRKKFEDMQAELDLARAAIIDLRARVKALEEA
jgi:hypothetical protein